MPRSKSTKGKKRKRKCSDSINYVWAKLPGCKTMWPVRVDNRQGGTLTVYCQSDDAEFTVDDSKTLEFTKNYTCLKQRGMVMLQKKTNMLTAFLTDCEWARASIDSDVKENDQDIIPCSQPSPSKDTLQFQIEASIDSDVKGNDQDIPCTQPSPSQDTLPAFQIEAPIDSDVKENDQDIPCTQPSPSQDTLPFQIEASIDSDVKGNDQDIPSTQPSPSQDTLPFQIEAPIDSDVKENDQDIRCTQPSPSQDTLPFQIEAPIDSDVKGNDQDIPCTQPSPSQDTLPFQIEAPIDSDVKGNDQDIPCTQPSPSQDTLPFQIEAPIDSDVKGNDQDIPCTQPSPSQDTLPFQIEASIDSDVKGNDQDIPCTQPSPSQDTLPFQIEAPIDSDVKGNDQDIPCTQPSPSQDTLPFQIEAPIDSDVKENDQDIPCTQPSPSQDTLPFQIEAPIDSDVKGNDQDIPCTQPSPSQDTLPFQIEAPIDSDVKGNDQDIPCTQPSPSQDTLPFQIEAPIDTDVKGNDQDIPCTQPSPSQDTLPFQIEAPIDSDVKENDQDIPCTQPSPSQDTLPFQIEASIDSDVKEGSIPSKQPSTQSRMDEGSISDVDDAFCDDSGDEFILGSSDTESESSHEIYGDIRSLHLFDFTEGEEVDILPEKNNPKLFITKIMRSKTTRDGKYKKNERVFNSYQFCLPCRKKVSNFSQHIYRQHKTDADLKHICDMNKTTERKNALSLLRNKFNHELNMESIRAGKGEIMLHKRPSEVFDISHYGPCPDCFLWIQTKLLKKHMKNCLKSTGHTTLGCITTKSDALAGRINKEASTKVVEEVFSIMRSDEISRVAKHDPLVVALGNVWMEKNIGNPQKRGKYTSQIMRLTARLLMELRKLKPQELDSFSDYLVPGNFNLLVQAVLSISLNTVHATETPSNALKLGYDLKRLINLKLVFSGIMESDQTARKDSEDLLQMMKVLWGTKVAKAARVLLDTKKFQKNAKLPKSEDIQKLHVYLAEELKKLDLEEKSYDNFIKVAEFAMSKLVTYNRRRTGEVEAVRVADYRKRTQGVVNDISELSSFEKNLLESQEVMEVRGKTGRGVPILIPTECMGALQYLSSQAVRDTCGISGPYLFARRGDGSVRAYDALQKIAASAGIDEPSRVTSTQLRKYMATITQVLDLNENQMSWVLNHMGHTLDVHKIHYRATSDVIERTQIAKILLMQDHDRIKDFANRKLSEIQMDELVQPSAKTYPRETEFGEIDEVLNASIGLDNPDTLDEKAQKARSHLTRKPWTQTEEKEIDTYFSACLSSLRRPTVIEIEKVRSKSKRLKGVLHLRSKETLKKKLFRMIDARKKMKTVSK